MAERIFFGTLVHSSSRTKSLSTPSWYASAQTRKENLGFLLKHFKRMDFPRKISTKTTEGRQILVNDRPQALARFEQANWLDCRISAYTEVDDSPNFLFIDIDTLDRSVLNKFFKDVRNKLEIQRSYSRAADIISISQCLQLTLVLCPILMDIVSFQNNS